MIVNLEVLRAVVRSLISTAIGVPELLERLWPILLEADDGAHELVESIEDLLALHAASSIDDMGLRHGLTMMTT